MLKITSFCLVTLHNGVLAYYDSTKPIVNMVDYGKEYRTLNCWECMEAKGVMCSYANG